MAASHTSNLWKFLPINEAIGGEAVGIAGNANAAPDLIPMNNFDPTNPAPDLINVVNDFEWTHTPAHGRQEVPTIRLSEYRLKNSPVLSNLKYHLAIGADAIKQAGNAMKGVPSGTSANLDWQAVANRWNTIRGGRKDWTPDQVKAYLNKTPAARKLMTKKELETMDKSASGKKKGMIEKAFSVGQEMIGSATSAIGGLGQNITVEAPDSVPHYLKPYWGLYDVLPTGFEYVFPYFDAMWKDKSAGWTDAKGGGLLGGLIGEATNFLREDVAKSIEMIPGTKGAYIEQPKMYSFPGTPPSRTFKFSLMNTNNFEDVSKNWQLIFLLLYQQLPNRENKVRVEPPAIYEIEIPGVFYTPFGFIRNISIQNRGAVREMRIPVLYEAGMRKELGLPVNPPDRSQPTWNKKIDHSLPVYSRSNNKTHGQSSTRQAEKKVKGKEQGVGSHGAHDPKLEYIDTLVPDAWDVTISVESLIPETKNLAFHSTLGPVTKATGLYSVTVDGSKDEVTKRWKK